MVNINQIKRGIANFADAEIINKIPGGTLKRTLFGTAVGLYINNLGTVISNVSTNPFVAALGIQDADHNFDIDKLAEEAKKNIPDTGLKIDLDLLGFHLGDMTLTRQDVETLRSFIASA
jgi:hypothetical protein